MDGWGKMNGGRADVRRKETPFRCEHRYVYVVALSDFSESHSQLKISVLIKGIEFLGLIECDDGDTIVLVFDEDGLVCHVERYFYVDCPKGWQYSKYKFAELLCS